MRIIVANWSRRKIGGAESYLETVIPALIQDGHEIGFWHETDQPAGNAEIHLPPQVAVWCAQSLGADRAVVELRRWRPELIYAHGVHDPALESVLTGIAPTVFFAHAYHGTCISGLKRFALPSARPCDRRFGWPCLLHFFPRRCGGVNPLTMWRDYLRQATRLATLRRCRAIVTNSRHMVSEYERHGLSAYRAPLPLAGLHDSPAKPRATPPDGTRRLLFLGRLEANKGGHLLIDAAAKARLLLDVPLLLVFAGDGRERSSWEHRAQRVQNGNSGLRIHFAGHVNAGQRDELIAASDLLVFPSLWPEPFGLSGPEAGLSSVPAAAFAVGGVSDWLIDGVSGFLAPADPPTADGLAHAIARCLRDPVAYARLRAGALQTARTFTMENHLAVLRSVFGQALDSS